MTNFFFFILRFSELLLKISSQCIISGEMTFSVDDDTSFVFSGLEKVLRVLED